MRRSGTRLSVLCRQAIGLLVALVLVPELGHAQGVLLDKLESGSPPKPAPKEPTTFQLTLGPAAEPIPALKYSLLPEYTELTPGNSVPYYYRAVLSLKNVPREFWRENLNFTDWLDVPISAFPREKARIILNTGGIVRAMEELRTAVYREQTDWQWRARELQGLESISFVLEETQESRQLARLLALQARLQIAEGKYDEAIETLQVGYALARDVGEQPFLISTLVGIAIASIMNEQVIALIDASDSPNLYWSLTALPEPLISTREALLYEMHLPLQIFPWLKDPEDAERAPQEWARLVTQGLLDLRQLDGAPTGQTEPGWQAQLAATGMIMAAYPQAKQALLADGFSEEKLGEMPAAQVVAIYQSRAYRQIYDETFKWAFLPYWQSRGRFDRATQRPSPGDLTAFVHVLLPAVEQVVTAEARLQSRTAALRVVEAIRMYAAEHDGDLPGSLEQIDAVPVPLNPMTGEPFPYRKEGDRAVLDVPAPEGHSPITAWRFEMTVSGE